MSGRFAPSGRLETLGSRVLVLTTKHVGTNLFCTPAIRLLRRHFPHARIDVLATSRRGAAVFEHNPDADTAFFTRSRWRVRRLATRYEVVLDLHYESAQRYAAGLSAKCVTIEPASAGKHRADVAHEFMQRILSCELQETDRCYVLVPPLESGDKIRRLLGDSSLPSSLVGFHLGSGKTANHGWMFWYSKRTKDRRLWALDNYIATVKLLQQARPEICFVLTGVRNETFLSRRFAKEVPRVIDLVGCSSLSDLAALMRFLRVFLHAT